MYKNIPNHMIETRVIEQVCGHLFGVAGRVMAYRRQGVGPVFGERVVNIIFGTGDMTKIEFMMEYRRDAIMGG